MADDDQHQGHQQAEKAELGGVEFEYQGGMSKRGDSRHHHGDSGMGGGEKDNKDSDDHGDHGSHDGGGHGMSEDQRKMMQAKHHARTQWVYFTIVILGIWMMVAPTTFDYYDNAMVWSDVISGALLVVFGFLAMHPFRPWALWACCFVGIWLEFAPLVFWAPEAVTYLNDTLVGMFVIALSILIPGMPWMIMIMKHGPEVPPGWTYCPSSWPQRAIMIALGFAGWLVSRYLAAYQLGYIDNIWDPFFGEGSRLVLESKMSKSWPISDAGLGAFSYTFEFLMGFMGAPSRWRTMPWMVLFFGILVVPLGLTHIVLVISQPVVVGSWCTGCLLAALIMLPMIPLTLDEVIAMGQLINQRVRKDGLPFWRTFWKGDSMEGGGQDERSPRMFESPWAIFKASLWGMSVPWTLLAATALGTWLAFSPLVFGTRGVAANSSHVVGMVTVVVTVIAWAEVARSFRFLNYLLGAWAVLGIWFLPGAPLAAQINSTIVGLLLIAVSVPRGVVKESYGGWDKYIV